jgi:hypothetical protein
MHCVNHTTKRRRVQGQIRLTNLARVEGEEKCCNDHHHYAAADEDEDANSVPDFFAYIY